MTNGSRWGPCLPSFRIIYLNASDLHTDGWAPPPPPHQQPPLPPSPLSSPSQVPAALLRRGCLPGATLRGPLKS